MADYWQLKKNHQAQQEQLSKRHDRAYLYFLVSMTLAFSVAGVLRSISTQQVLILQLSILPLLIALPLVSHETMKGRSIDLEITRCLLEGLKLEKERDFKEDYFKKRTLEYLQKPFFGKRLIPILGLLGLILFKAHHSFSKTKALSENPHLLLYATVCCCISLSVYMLWYLSRPYIRLKIVLGDQQGENAPILDYVLDLLSTIPHLKKILKMTGVFFAFYCGAAFVFGKWGSVSDWLLAAFCYIACGVIFGYFFVRWDKRDDKRKGERQDPLS